MLDPAYPLGVAAISVGVPTFVGVPAYPLAVDAISVGVPAYPLGGIASPMWAAG